MSISFNVIPAGAIASGVFIEQEAVERSLGDAIIPQRIALLGQYNSGYAPTANTAVQILSATDAATRFGRGSLLHLLAKKAFRSCGTVPVYAIPLADGGSSTPGVTTLACAVSYLEAGTYALYIAGVRVPVTITAAMDADAVAAAIVAAITANLDLPVTAAVGTTGSEHIVTLTSKWQGLSANGITVLANQQDGDKTPTGLTVTIASSTLSSGSNDPELTTALGLLGDRWYTWVVNPYTADTQMDEMESAGDDRIAYDVKMPFIGVEGYTGTKANYLTLLASRNSPWSTIVPVEGSPNLPGEIAAAVAGACARSAQANPARPWRELELIDIVGGTSAKWTSSEREAVEAAGGSVTRRSDDGEVTIYDLLTTYTTDTSGDDDDVWRYPETIANIQAKLYSLNAVFSATPFDRAIVVDDDAVTSQSYVVSPKRVKAYVIKLIDELWIPQGWSKERDAIVAGIEAAIDTANAGRINVLVPDVLSAGLRIVAIKYEWGFSAAAAA